MLYLAIMVFVAVVGITRLWLQQRREGARMNSVDGFREGLQALSTPSDVQPARRPVRSSPARPTAARTARGPQPLDPARREAAKRRIEARRRARRHVA
ncbi:MAG: hypothetical protein ACLGHL_02960 [Actinomycetota bacterium]